MYYDLTNLIWNLFWYIFIVMLFMSCDNIVNAYKKRTPKVRDVWMAVLFPYALLRIFYLILKYIFLYSKFFLLKWFAYIKKNKHDPFKD